MCSCKPYRILYMGKSCYEIRNWGRCGRVCAIWLEHTSATCVISTKKNLMNTSHRLGWNQLGRAVFGEGCLYYSVSLSPAMFEQCSTSFAFGPWPNKISLKTVRLFLSHKRAIELFSFSFCFTDRRDLGKVRSPPSFDVLKDQGISPPSFHDAGFGRSHRLGYLHTRVKSFWHCDLMRQQSLDKIDWPRGTLNIGFLRLFHPTAVGLRGMG